MFTTIHEIVFHGNGGYDWETIYNMPVWLRRFTFNKIQEYFDKQNEEAEKQQKIVSNKTDIKEIARPNIQSPSPNPTYSYKAPKK